MGTLFPDATPLMGFLGGVMIGIAGAIMLLGLGRIAGVSGMAATVLGIGEQGSDRKLALTFIIGLPLGAALMSLTGPMRIAFPDSISLLVIGGLLVGFGTRLGSGCTSGHGVCGVSRLSPRSLVATGLFMAAGFATVAIMRLAGML
ncbi:YeeE/YedE family protein [Sphingobium cupriresistens]|uniref:YeeE/YedE family protein n=1 Tax=Sphingobium cupriresistens TaxID=1132417 RepID=A0A8G1ZFM8_9SPHN|nr:YeeE/YedE thiosulfate transporter family protein [Sphingobium cupriresistens]RYM10481.1 YeeE/YedE family protein [Sphingobium cupriresistens]